MNEDRTDYRYEWKGSETEGILYTVYSMAQQFHEHKMDVIKNGSLNEKQRKKSVYADGDLLVFSVMGQLLREYLHMLLMTRLGIMKW
jgi:hypothetical protein